MLINILAGLALASRSSVRVMGHDVIPDIVKHVACWVWCRLVFDPFFPVRETLVFQSGYYGLKKNNSWVDEIIYHLDLADKADTNMHSLSGGMKWRVLVAQALVTNHR